MGLSFNADQWFGDSLGLFVGIVLGAAVTWI
ncbi:hypothetical protein SAMN05216323_101415 [Williamwhitmania taraxaci]|uniref:Uncharacterized protein n=1 Tax=Williamwhitmania taraxaci TaxID=1640674 RepID=A0A1G6I0B8_9BACT|nr:hypothetical protein SAMN05216323_101415 [Williamwhitmania taraxaci]